MKKEKIDFKEECKTLPDPELRVIYKKLKKRQSIWANFPSTLLLPAAIFFGIQGWLTIMIFLESLGQVGFDTTLDFMDFFFFALSGLLFTSKNVRTIKLTPVFYIFTVILKTLYINRLNIAAPLMIIYVVTAAVKLSSVVEQLNFLRSLPNFPFEVRQKEIQFSGMTRAQMLKYLEREASGGVSTIDYEDIFTSDNPEEIANPKRDTQEDLQQHKIRYGNENRKSDMSRFDNWRG